jgi:hypothetical protein
VINTSTTMHPGKRDAHSDTRHSLLRAVGGALHYAVEMHVGITSTMSRLTLVEAFEWL